MTSVIDAPRLTPDDAARIARDVFDLTARATALPSERDQNFRLQVADGTCAVLKVANAGEDRRMLDAENATMRHLAATGVGPVPLRSKTGDDIVRCGRHFVRLITWLDGRPLGETPLQTDALLADVGRTVGLMDRALASLSISRRRAPRAVSVLFCTGAVRSR